MELRRSTVYINADLHKALRIKAAHTDKTLSELVNEAVRRSLKEDAEDQSALKHRATEPNLAYESVLEDLKKQGKI